jgi:LmbE family N-acetylglucosaminyl deacetylase
MPGEMPCLRTVARWFRRSALQAWAALLAGSKPGFNGTLLIIAPHPDDETFGTGGLIASLIQQGTGDGALAAGDKQPIAGSRPLQSGLCNSAPAVHVVFLTSGGASHAGCCGIPAEALGGRREAAAIKATGLLGVPSGNLHFLRWPDGHLPHPGVVDFEDARGRLSQVIRQINPDSIFTPHPFEGWSDHMAAESLTRAAMLHANSAALLYHYCVWFWFSMPLRRAFQLDWRNALIFSSSKSPLPVPGSEPAFALKREAIRIYLDDLAPCGKATCGVLPLEFLRAFEWKKELFFRADKLQT